MVGERHFAARDRLLGCFSRIRDLAASSDVDWPDESGSAREKLARPIRLVVLGEINAGKSTLLNALVGAELCPAGPLPTTQRTTLYRHASSERATERNGWQILGRPLDLLRRFELIDTPGTNSGWKDGVFADIPRFEKADLLLVVFPSGNTWTAATWDLVSALGDEALERTALVVQQSDQKSPEDLRVIEGHMRDLCLKKVGRELPIVAVAAGLALEAKLDPPEARKSWSASRFGAFEEFLTATVCESPSRRYLIDRTMQEAGDRLRDIESALDRQRRSMDDDGWFLAGLEREARQLRDLVLENSPKTLAGARGRYENEVARLSRALGRMLGVGPTLWRLFVGDASPARIEARLADGLGEAIRDFAAVDAERLLEECEGHWNDVRPRVIERMGLDPGTAAIHGDGREATTGRFVANVARAVPGVLGQLRVRACLDAPLRARNRRLRFLLAMVLLLTTAAGACGALGIDRWAWPLAFAAAGMGGVFLLSAWVSRIRIVGQTRERLRDSVGRFETAMREDYGEAVRALFDEYANGLIGVRRQLADRQATLKPRQDQWDRLHLELRSIEQDHQP
jgi:hypothetical protein